MIRTECSEMSLLRGFSRYPFVREKLKVVSLAFRQYPGKRFRVNSWVFGNHFGGSRLGGRICLYDSPTSKLEVAGHTDVGGGLPWPSPTKLSTRVSSSRRRCASSLTVRPRL